MFSSNNGPFLSQADPGYSKEGGLNPLGLYAIGDTLGVQLVPGVRERMSDPRYLTIIVVGMAVCAELGSDRIAADGKSEPWQVFEWYVVEALVRTYGDKSNMIGLPGIEKARAALRNNLPLAANTYLKTPQVFGFHGVYRVLGQELELFDDAGLLPLGWELVEAWQKDQELNGCYNTKDEYAGFKYSLMNAVDAGLEQGATNRSHSWGGWKKIAKYLAPGSSGTGELEVLRKALRGNEGGHRQQILDFLASDQGQQAWNPNAEDECAFHEALRPHANDSLQQLLQGISSYEEFARLLQNAFEECLYKLNDSCKPLKPGELTEETGAIKCAFTKIPNTYKEAAQYLEPLNERGRFEQTFSALANVDNQKHWLEALFNHHYQTQSRKPPAGKNPWLDRFDDGSFAVRAAYSRDKSVLGNNQYVHYYRTRPLVSFARALGML